MAIRDRLTVDACRTKRGWEDEKFLSWQRVFLSPNRRLRRNRKLANWNDGGHWMGDNLCRIYIFGSHWSIFIAPVARSIASVVPLHSCLIGHSRGFIWVFFRMIIGRIFSQLNQAQRFCILPFISRPSSIKVRPSPLLAIHSCRLPFLFALRSAPCTLLDKYTRREVDPALSKHRPGGMNQAVDKHYCKT